MRRFQGEPLPERPLVAVVANDAIGNYVVSTPLLQMLRASYDCTIHYYSGTRVAELAQADGSIDLFEPLLGSEPGNVVADSVVHRKDAYDLVINIEWSAWHKAFAAIIGRDALVCGPCLAPDGRGDWDFPDDQRGDLWRDQQWISPNLTDTYPFLRSGFIAEIFARLAYLDGEVPRYRVPSQEPPMDVPGVLIATAASLPEKLWPGEKWRALSEELIRRGSSIGLIGAKPSLQSRFWRGAEAEEELVASGMVQDLRGSMTLPQVVGALKSARQVVTLDNGILHLAASTQTPTVGLFRQGIHRLWAPPYEHVTAITPGEDESVAEIQVSEVLDAI